jgi:hypothetical protein
MIFPNYTENASRSVDALPCFVFSRVILNFIFVIGEYMNICSLHFTCAVAQQIMVSLCFILYVDGFP